MIAVHADAPQHTPVAFVERYYHYAKETERKTGIDARFILAQAALETGWGASVKGNLFFGIKARKDTPVEKRQLMLTREVLATNDRIFPEIISIKKLPSGKYEYLVRDWFRKYNTPEESFTDHARHLTQNARYAEALKVKDDPYLFAEAIAKAGYATDPLYTVKLKNLIYRIEHEYKVVLSGR